MTDRELMQMALDALDLHAKQYPHMVKGYTTDAAEAIRARLSQPEPAECDGGQCGIGGYCKECPKTQQEPTARDINEVILNSIHDSSEVVAQPQRQWQGLMDEEITETLKRFGLGERAALARAIEAKLKEKNT